MLYLLAGLGEYDLITICDDAVLGRCVCRPFAAERNTSMYLGRITLEKGCTVGLTSHVAAGAHLRPFTELGPNSSSWEADTAGPTKHVSNPVKNANSHWLLKILVIPIQVLARFLKALPWMAALIGLVVEEPEQMDSFGDQVGAVLRWFAVCTFRPKSDSCVAANSYFRVLIG